MHDEQLHKHAGHAATHEHDAGAHAHGDKRDGSEHHVQFRASGKLPEAGHGFEHGKKQSASDSAYGHGEHHTKLAGLGEKVRHHKHGKHGTHHKQEHPGNGQAHVEPMPGGAGPATEAPQAEGAGAVLQQGDHGPEVAELQQLLKAAGYYHAQIGGNFGPQTKTALVSFQADHGIDATGTADAQTIDVLHQTAPAVAAPSTEAAPAPQTEQAPPSVGGQAACDYGTSVLGAPYMALNPYRFGEVLWKGGSAVDIHGKERGPFEAGTQLFDCSGFVVAAWKHAGVNLLAHNLGDSASLCDNESFLHTISAGELQPGDIIAWHGHVGMYYGNGQVIESTPNGGVKISDAAKFTGHAGAKCKRVPG